MRIRRALLISSMLLTLAALSGCGLMGGDITALMKAPRPNTMQEQLSLAIRSTLGDNLKYISPVSGASRSSFILQDLDGDGVDEAVVFFTMLDAAGANNNASVAVFTEGADGAWELTRRITGESDTVDYADFRDVSGDGCADLLCGWIKGESARLLCAYDLHAKNDAPIFSDAYNECRLFFNDEDELFIFTLSLDKESGAGVAKVMAVEDAALSTIASCAVDAHFETVTDITYARISASRKAIIVDARQGNNAVTQILFYNGSTLTNPFYVDGALSPYLVRETAYACRDIDKDGIIEIPYASAMPELSPAPAVGAVMQMTNWATVDLTEISSPDGNPLAFDFTCIMNGPLNYYYIIPPAWQGRITAYYNTADYSMTFYHLSPGSTGGTQIFSLQVLTSAEYNKRVEQGNWYELRRDEGKEYAIHIEQNLPPDIKLMLGAVEDSRSRLILYS